jgi:hypothetical protein
LAFRSSSALAYAYGMAVTGTITITTLLFFYVVRHQWRKPRWLVALGATPLLGIDLLFLAANATKIAHGAWLPLLIAITAFTVLTTWQRGRELVTERREREEGPLREFIEVLHRPSPPIDRVPGTAVFLNRGKVTAPLAMRATVEHLHVVSENVVILTIDTQPVPHVPSADRLVLDDLGYSDDGIMHATARFGYLDEPIVPSVLRQSTCSWRPPASRRTRPSISASRAIARWSWVRGSRSSSSGRASAVHAAAARCVVRLPAGSRHVFVVDVRVHLGGARLVLARGLTLPVRLLAGLARLARHLLGAAFLLRCGLLGLLCLRVSSGCDLPLLACDRTLLLELLLAASPCAQ